MTVATPTRATTTRTQHAQAGVPRWRSSTHGAVAGEGPNGGSGPGSTPSKCVRGEGGTVEYGSYVDEVLMMAGSAGKHYVHANHLYSPSALTDSTGAVKERYRYDAYGKRTVLAPTGGTVRTVSSVGFERGFTGYHLDQEIGLYYARARMYSVGLGRFIGRDPVLIREGYPSGSTNFSPILTDFSTWATPFGADGYSANGLSLYAGYFVTNHIDPYGYYTVNSCDIAIIVGHNNTVPQKGDFKESKCSRSSIIACKSLGQVGYDPAVVTQPIPNAQNGGQAGPTFLGYDEAASRARADYQSGKSFAPSLCKPNPESCCDKVSVYVDLEFEWDLISRNLFNSMTPGRNIAKLSNVYDCKSKTWENSGEEKIDDFGHR